MTPTELLESIRLERIRAHACAVFWLSVTARSHDILKRPDLARQASLDAAANCRCIWALAGATHNQGSNP